MRRSILALVFLLLASLCAAAEGEPEPIKLRGEWVDGVLRSKQPDQTNPGEIRGDGVAGYIQEHGPGWFRIGPIRVDLVPDTEFRDLAPGDLVPGRAVKVRGRMTEPGRLEAEKIRPTSIHPEDIQLWGVPSERVILDEGTDRLVLLGVPVDLPSEEKERLIKLARRPEDVRPPEQLQVPIFGRPLTIGGELENNFRSRIDYRLEPEREDDDVRIEQKFKLELLYEWSKTISVLVTGKARYQGEVYREDGQEDIQAGAERDESWIYFSEIMGSGFSLQIGRQDFRERLNWWWDQDVDAVRVHFDRDRLHLEAAVARNLTPSDSSDDDQGDPATDRALRVLSHVRWHWTEKHWIEGFFLYTDADIEEPVPGSIVSESFNTIPEPNLHWLGGRVRGEFEPAQGHGLGYRLQAAWVEGKERLSILDDTDDDLQVVVSRKTFSISGWGLDGALTWQLPDVAGRPSLTLGGAVGSANEIDDLRYSRGFRQTDMQSNAARIEGVNRIRYYGELYRPSLSNMAVSTALLTARFWEKSSIELVFHTYHQLDAAPFVSDSAINTRPGGERKDLGFETDLVLGLREWEHIDFQIVFGLFRAGDAYGASSGRTAELVALSLDYGF